MASQPGEPRARFVLALTPTMTARATTLSRGRPRRALRRFARCLAIAAALLLPLQAASCKKDTPQPPEKVAPLEPVPAPAGLLAEFFVPNPESAWAKARAAVAGPAMFLPQSASMLAATMIGLPMTASIEIDEKVPVVGAIVERPEGGRPRIALGLHVRDGDKLVDLVTKGENPRLTSRLDPKTSIKLLEPKEGGERAVAIGVLGNYLLVSQSIADLLEVGPYVARTLPSAKMQKDDLTIELPREALAGPIAKGLRSGWESLRPKPRGNAPDAVAAPPPVPNPLNGFVDSLVAIVAELDHARVTLNFDDKAARLSLVGTPREGGSGAASVASMVVGDPRRMLELPADSEVAIFLHDASKTRVEDAKGYGKSLASAIGKDITESDRGAIEAALVAVAEGRGDTFTAGLTLLSTGPAAYVRSDVASGEVLGKGLDDLFGLVKLPSVAAWLAGSKIGVSTGKTVLENIPGDVHRVRLERIEEKDEGDKKSGKDKPGAKDKPKKDAGKKEEAKSADPAAGPPPSIDVLYMLGKDGLVLAAGYEAKAALRTVLDAPTHENLLGRADVKAAIEAVGGSAAFVAFLDPIRLLARRAGKSELGPSAPVVFSLGKGGEGRAAGEPWIKLDVANPAIQELIKRRGAL